MSVDDDVENWRSEHVHHKIDDDAWEKMPLFMETITEEDVLINPNVASLASILHDETPPHELAERLKNSANNNLRMSLGNKNKNLILSAIDLYSQAIEVNCDDCRLNATIYSNRSQAHLYRENFLAALQDAQKAIELDSSYQKAHYRYAVALFKLNRYDEALKLLSDLKKDLTQDTTVPMDIAQLEKSINARVGERIATEKKRSIIAEEKSNQLKKAQDVIHRLKIRQGPAELDSEQWDQLPRCYPREELETGRVKIYFPILFLYDAHGQSDFVESASWETSISQQLDMVFNETPSWDGEKEYTDLSQLMAFYCLPNGVYRQVSLDKSLKEILRDSNYVLPGMIPTFHVLPNGHPIVFHWLSGTPL